MKEDLKTFLSKNLDEMAENHLELWKGRYYRKSIDSVQYDLNVNHDISSEVDYIEHELGRKLSSDEVDYVSSEFIRSVLKNFYE